MLLRAYLPKFITALLGGLFIATGILTFGNAMVFERLYFGILVFTTVICRNNINVVSIVIILFLQLALEKLAFLYLSDRYLIKVLLYSVILYAIYYFRYDWTAKVILPTMLLVVGSEAYWYTTAYPSPEIYWHTFIMLSNLVIRYFIFSRVSFVSQYFSQQGQSVNLDWVIYKLSALVIFVQAAILLEYLARHIFGLSNALFVYYSYPYFIHAIATVAIWATFSESFQFMLPRVLKA